MTDSSTETSAKVESNANFIKRVRPQVSQYETTLLEALDRLEHLEKFLANADKVRRERDRLQAECERLRGEVERQEKNYQAAVKGRQEFRTALRKCREENKPTEPPAGTHYHD